MRRWSGIDGEDPLLVLQRASGQRPETLARFLDTQFLDPLVRCLRGYGFGDAGSLARAPAIDALCSGFPRAGVSCAMISVTPRPLQDWLGPVVQRLVDGS